MNTVHLYLRPAPAGALNVARHTFPPGGAPALTRETIAAAASEAWLATQLADPTVKAIYNCAGSPATKPEACTIPWVPLPAGHPCASL